MRLTRITLAAEDLDAMVAFYDGVFGCHLVASGPLYVGELAGLPFAMCPNDLAGVVASQNRHQLRIAVDDVASTVARVTELGGEVMDAASTPALTAIADPDGNTYELCDSEPTSSG
jgi:catechol 2,3-dioxygenase-like lactoylglutathione lyase family enzyme